MSVPNAHREDSPVSFGVAIFAGVMLATLSLFQIMQGLAAIFENTVYVSGIDYVWEIDVTAWGWIHLILGIVGVATGIGILTNQTWAAFVGIAIAVLVALAEFMFLPYYPFWSILVIAFSVLVIWALSEQLSRR
jgi:hypothetical protein